MTTTTITGTAGNDTLFSIGADELFNGLSGNDTASYANVSFGVAASLAISGAQNVGHWSDTFISIENLAGSNFNDVLTGSSAQNILLGGGGDDSLYGGGGNDKLEGGTGHNLLDGGTGVNTAGYNDAAGAVTVSLLLAGIAQNTIGSGVDTLVNIQNLTGSAFNDTLTGDNNNNVLTGNAGDDTLYGGLGNDTLLGSAGDDAIYGGGNNDSLSGGVGNDTLDGGAGPDTLNGGAGNDTASYGSATSAVTVDLNQQGFAQFTGGAGNDTLFSIENATGSSFNDTLTGDTSSNVLSGGSGNDTLIGGVGGDTLYGGAGADHFVYAAASDSMFSHGTQDQIMDFSHAEGDLIDLSAISASLTLVAGFTGAANQLIEVAKPGGYLVEGDLNGDAKPDFAIMVHTATALVASDFIL
jgi:Ca2+-binding RTX toxin-like protein